MKGAFLVAFSLCIATTLAAEIPYVYVVLASQPEVIHVWDEFAREMNTIPVGDAVRSLTQLDSRTLAWRTPASQWRVTVATLSENRTALESLRDVNLPDKLNDPNCGDYPQGFYALPDALGNKVVYLNYMMKSGTGMCLVPLKLDSGAAGDVLYIRNANVWGLTGPETAFVQSRDNNKFGIVSLTTGQFIREIQMPEDAAPMCGCAFAHGRLAILRAQMRHSRVYLTDPDMSKFEMVLEDPVTGFYPHNLVLEREAVWFTPVDNRATRYRLSDGTIWTSIALNQNERFEGFASIN